MFVKCAHTSHLMLYMYRSSGKLLSNGRGILKFSWNSKERGSSYLTVNGYFQWILTSWIKVTTFGNKASNIIQRISKLVCVVPWALHCYKYETQILNAISIFNSIILLIGKYLNRERWYREEGEWKETRDIREWGEIKEMAAGPGWDDA